jgi:hypothetical protein
MATDIVSLFTSLILQYFTNVYVSGLHILKEISLTILKNVYAVTDKFMGGSTYGARGQLTPELKVFLKISL